MTSEDVHKISEKLRLMEKNVNESIILSGKTVHLKGFRGEGGIYSHDLFGVDLKKVGNRWHAKLFITPETLQHSAVNIRVLKNRLKQAKNLPNDLNKKLDLPPKKEEMSGILTRSLQKHPCLATKSIESQAVSGVLRALLTNNVKFVEVKPLKTGKEGTGHTLEKRYAKAYKEHMR